MKRIAGSIAVAALVLLVSTAFGLSDDTPKRLTFDQVSGLVQALSALDGRTRVVRDGAQERIVTEPYDLAPGMRLLVAQNLVRAKAALVPFQSTFAQVQRQFAGQDGRVPDDRLVEFNLAIRKMQDSFADGEFASMRYEELKPATNALPPSVLAGLMPLLVFPEK